jgi:transcriptional regulator with XRE-family HTH domain
MTKINRLKAVLAEKDKSGKWLADQLGKSTCTVSKWCSNTTQPDLQTLTKIAQLLNIDARDLLIPSNTSNQTF